MLTELSEVQVLIISVHPGDVMVPRCSDLHVQTDKQKADFEKFRTLEGVLKKSVLVI